MHNLFHLLLPLLITSNYCVSQTYTSYFTGNATDVITNPSGGICLMGGATEEDEAMKWFLQRANGGDVLVLRASGSDGYNNYLYSSLGITVNSVETIVFDSPAASNESYIHNKISKAEAIWFAGGDQWNYVSYWRGTAIDSLINDRIQNRQIVIGGTSAGMAILGSLYFSAQNGTITSSTALNNPYDPNLTVDSTGFLALPYLDRVITDTHYDNPMRKGRHIVFLARSFVDYGIEAKGIACDEFTAVCIDSSGIAHVFGQYPTYDDNAYFIQTNCEIGDLTPEVCQAGSPLTWQLGESPVKVYAVKGSSTGLNTFDLNDWQSGEGGIWQNWSVNAGTLMEENGQAVDCPIVSIDDPLWHSVQIYPNPSQDLVRIVSPYRIEQVLLTDTSGKQLFKQESMDSFSHTLDLSRLDAGLYLIHLYTEKGKKVWKQRK